MNHTVWIHSLSWRTALKFCMLRCCGCCRCCADARIAHYTHAQQYPVCERDLRSLFAGWLARSLTASTLLARRDLLHVYCICVRVMRTNE